jgi:CBS domain-containing protein
MISTSPVGTPRSLRTVRSNLTIRAKDIMTRGNLVTVTPQASVRRVAQLLSENHVSSVLVLGKDGSLEGIVSEGDLLHRQELGTDMDDTSPGKVKSHAMCAGEIMSRSLVTVTEETPLADVVRALHANHVRRAPVVRDKKVVGLVARADIMRALAARPEGSSGPSSRDDDMIRYHAIETLLSIPGTSPWATTVTVSNGVVELDGAVEMEKTREPSRIAIEAIPDVVEVRDRRAVMQPY